MTTTDHIKGQFSTPIDVNAPKSIRKIGPLKMALGRAISELGTLYTTGAVCPDFPDMTPIEEDFDAIAEYVKKVSLIMGRWLRATGIEVRANALCNIEMARFAEDTFLEAIDGWATDEIYTAGRAASDALEDAGHGDAGDRAWNERRV